MSDEGKEAKERDTLEEIDAQEETDDLSEETVEEKTRDLEDPQETLRNKCRSECKNHVEKLDKCNERVLSKSATQEICFEELIDVLHCVDHCVAHDLFKFLK